MNILITGAIGFIGKALYEKMLAREWRVMGTVRDLEDLKKFPAEVDIVEIKSIGPDTDWSKALNGVDAVVHLAARVHEWLRAEVTPVEHPGREPGSTGQGG